MSVTGRMRAIGGLALGAGAAVLAGCVDAGGSRHLQPPVGLGLELIARSARLPYSLSRHHAVVAPDRACIHDSYTVELVCGDRSWLVRVRTGREGEGPGEIRPRGYLVAGPDGTLGYVDLGNMRVAVYSPELELLRSVRFTVLAAPAGRISEDWILPLEVPNIDRETRLMWIDLAADSVVERLNFMADPTLLPEDSLWFRSIVQTPAGDLVGRLGQDHLAWYSRAGQFMYLSEIPEFPDVFPSEAEVDRYLEVWTIGGRSPRPERVEGFRQRRLRRVIGEHAYDVDAAGRLWVGTNRPGGIGTYVDVFRGGDRLGTIEIEGRLHSLRIRDSLLVVMVGELEPDAAGVHRSRLDWYRIVES